MRQSVDNWEKVRLGDESLFGIGLGGTPATANESYWDGDIPWITPTDLSRSRTPTISQTERTISKEGVKNSSARLLPPGSIVISTRAPIGYLAVTGREMTINQGCKAVIVKDSQKVFSPYLYYRLLTLVSKMKELGTGSTFKELSQNDLKSVEFPLPLPPEQAEIVHVLDAIQEAIRMQGDIIERTRELKRAMMYQYFELAQSGGGGKKRLLRDICLPTEQRDPAKEPKRLIKYIDVSSISNEKFTIMDSKEYLGEDAPGRARKVVRKNDVIFATIRPSLKRVALISDNLDGEFCSTAFCVIRVNKKETLPYYIFSYLTTDLFVNEVSGLQRGSGYPAIRDSDVFTRYVYLPDLKVQAEIVKILYEIDQRIDVEEKRRIFYQELFQTMLHELMSGKTKVNHLSGL